MKKFFSALIVLAVISSAVVAETKSAFSINASIPLDNMTRKQEMSILSESTKLTNASFGFGISGLTFFNNLIGIYSSVDVAFLLNTQSDNGSFSREDLYGSNGKQYSLNVMVGPVFKIIDKNNMLFTAAPAVHMYSNHEKVGSYSNSGTLIGLGGNASFSYFFNDLIGITAGADIAFDFIGLGAYKKTTETYSGYGYNYDLTTKYSNLQFAPKFGVTFKF